jgi:hypothetical protein
MDKNMDAVAEKPRWVGAARRALLGSALFLTASAPALAGSTTLICNMDAANSWKQDEPTIVELNEAQGTVVVHFSPLTLPLNGSHSPASSIGPLPGTFSADTISFVDPHPPGILSNFTINRLTGALFESNSNWRWICQPGKKQF